MIAHRQREPKKVRQKGAEFFVSVPRCVHGSAILLLMLFAALAPRVARAQGSADEYELKAAMLYNMMQFVDWPPSAYSDGQSPNLLCVLGWDPFGPSLLALVSKKPLKGRPTELRHFHSSDGVRSCHVLYISSTERKNLVQILSSLKGSSVLTVGEMAQFASRGGMIQFALDEKQVHLDINLDAASRAEIKISSRLLVLATIVRDESSDPRKQGATVPYPAPSAAVRLRSAGFLLANLPSLDDVGVYADVLRHGRE